MKILKTGMTKGVAIIAISMMLTTPVMAATITRNVIKPNADVMLPGKAVSSPGTFIVPNYVEEKTLKVGGYPYQAGDTHKQNTIVVKRSPDGNVFKLSIDAKQFPNVHSVEVAGDQGSYIEEFDEYAPGRMDSWGIKVFKSNGQNKEVIVSQDFLNLGSWDENEMLGFYLVFLDKNGGELYYIPNFALLILNADGTETIATSSKASKPSKKIAIEIDGKNIPSTVSPIQEKGTTFVPIRVVSEYLGTKVDYNQKNKEITLIKKNQVIKLKIGSKQASTNGISSTLTVAPRLVNGITFVPIRMIAETFNSEVQWDRENQKVIIVNK